MRVYSEDNGVTGAQFRPRASFTAAARRLVPSIFGNQIFARDLWKSARWCSAKSLGEFTLGIIDRFAQRQRPAHKRKSSAPLPSSFVLGRDRRHWKPAIPRLQIASVTIELEPRRR